MSGGYLENRTFDEIRVGDPLASDEPSRFAPHRKGIGGPSRRSEQARAASMSPAVPGATSVLWEL